MTKDPQPLPEDPIPDDTEEQPAKALSAELAVLEEEVQRRIRNNQRFLDRFMDDTFDEDALTDDEEESDPDFYEEL